VQPLIEIIYMSRSTFTPSRLVMNIEPNVARILAKSRINNRRNGLVGVLYFGDGCFFQCLQGEETAVDALYALLQSDNRHQDLKLFSRKQISALAYADWSMKYVPIEKDMTRLLEKRGYQKFDPYQFDDAMIQDVMSLLQRSPDPTTGSKVEKMIQQSIKAPGAAKSKLGWSIVALIALVAAVGIMIVVQQK
jgi:hypothetical protein